MSRRQSAHQAGGAVCSCPACRAKQTTKGQTLINEYNEWAVTKTTHGHASMTQTATEENATR